MADIQPKNFYLLQIGYLGTKYVGWQRQINVKLKSVQQVVEEALALGVKGISRTDKGTHALGQWGLTRTFDELSVEEVNKKLPESIRVYRIEKLPSYRFPLVESKKYVYYIEQASRPTPLYAPYSWFIAKKLDLDRLQAALYYLVGTHDFYHLSSGPKRKTTTRTIFSIRVVVKHRMDFSLDGCTGQDLDFEPRTEDPHMICIEFIGDGFLQHMIRRIIGSVRPVAESNDLGLNTLDLMRSGAIPAGPAAPARGLWLENVVYNT